MMAMTIQISDILDYLVIAVEEARRTAPADWQHAVEDGYDWLLSQDSVEVENGILDFEGRYSVNGTCGCTAYTFHNPCRHRAARQLLARALARKGRTGQ